MNGVHRLARACVLLAACFAQNPPQQQDQSLRVNVNLIQIDVTVLDKSGKHFPGLTTADFEVSRDGKRQAIKKVLYVSRPPVAPEPTPAEATVVPASLLSTSLSTSLPGKQLQPQDVRRTIAIFIDDLSINFANLLPTREAIKKFAENEVRPGDLVAVYLSSTGLGLFQQFTTDRRALLASIDRIRYRSMNGVDSLAPISHNPMEDNPDPSLAQQALEQRLREEVAMQTRQDMLTAGMLSSAGFIVRGLRDLPGRKSMVIFSESIQLIDIPKTLTNPNATAMGPGGMGDTRQRTIRAMRSLTDLANRNGVTFYTVDPRGLQPLQPTAEDQLPANPRQIQGRMDQRKSDFFSSQDGMAVLADETGGLFFRNSNDLGRALAEAANDLDGYYLIAFEPDEETFEKTKQGAARTHRLSIKVRKPGLKVRFRKSFVGIADKEPEAASSNPLVTAMFSPFRSLEIPMKLTPLYLESEKSGPFIRAFLFVDPARFQFEDEAAAESDKDKTPWKKAVADEMVVLYDQHGKPVENVSQTQTIRLRKAALEHAMKNGLVQVLDIPVKQPGPYQIRAAFMDKATKLTGSAAQFVFIPDVKNKQLAMSDIAIATEAFLQAKSADGAPGIRVLRGGDKLVYQAQIYNARVIKEGGTTNVECQVILYREGKAVFTGKKTPYNPTGHVEGKSLTLSGSLTLGKNAAPGDYALQIAVRDLEAPKKGQFAVRAADFEVRAQ